MTASSNYELYVNGYQLPTQANTYNWQSTDMYSIVYGSLIAIKVMGSPPLYGLLGSGGISGSYAFYTSSAWRCANNFETNWYLTSFNDQRWIYASEKGNNYLSPPPWNKYFPEIAPEARWIWSYDNSASSAYFRFRKIKKTCLFVH